MGKNDAYWAGFNIGKTGGKYNASGYTDEEELAWYKKGYNAGSNGNFVSVDSNGNAVNGDGTSTFVNTQNNDDGMDAVFKIIDQYSKPDYTPFTGGGFADFLKQYGNENARAYSEGVREANSAFYRSLMNYGKNAEMLGANGLSSSGVSDYGNAAAYAARQGAVTELGKARLEADTDAMSEYTGRISAANAEGKAQAQAMANAKVQGLLSAIQSDIFDEASARIFAQQAGVYDEAEIDKFVGALSAYGKSQQDKQTAANGETLFANTQALFDNFISNGLSPEQAKAKVEQYARQMPSAYNAELIDSIYNTHVNVQNMGKRDDPNYVDPNDETYKVNLAAATEAYNKSRADGNSHETALSGVKTAGITDERILNQLKTNYDSGIINNAQNSLQQMLASANYSVAQKATSEGGKYVSKEYLDNLVAQNILTEDSEAYKNQLDQLQAKNSESLMNLIDGAHDNGAKGFDLRMACAEFGIAYDEANKEAVGAEVVKAARERAEELYLAGDISAKQYSDYIKTDFDYEIYAYQDEGNILYNLCGSLVSLSDYVDQIDGISEEVYNELLDVALEQMEILDVEYDKTTVGGEPALKISYKNKNTRFKENVKLEFQSKGLSAGVVDYEKHGDVVSEFVTTNGLKFDKYESGGYKISNVNLNPHSLRYALNYNNYIHSELSNKKFSTDMGNVILDLMERQFSSK